MVSMMCPGISYSTVHSLIFHNNGSVQDNKLFQEFCNKKHAHFVSDDYEITEETIDNETRTLKDQPLLEKHDVKNTAITMDYVVITTFIKIHNISATWEIDQFLFVDDQSNSSYQLKVGSYWCEEGDTFDCCPPM